MKYEPKQQPISPAAAKKEYIFALKRKYCAVNDKVPGHSPAHPTPTKIMPIKLNIGIGDKDVNK